MEILFEDKNYIVVNKPSGLMVHPDGRSEEETLSEWFAGEYPDSKDVGEPLVITKGEEERKITRSGIVHRLDKDTSGAIVLCKTVEAHVNLKKQFQERLVDKTYFAVVWGNITEETGVINAAIGKSRNNFRQWMAGSRARGTMREAVTSYSVVKRIQEDGEHFCVVTARPKTGRTHQIRVHMKHRHHAIVCDSLYAPKKPCVLGFNRLALHAWRITFLGLDGEEISVEAPLPEEFQRVLA